MSLVGQNGATVADYDCVAVGGVVMASTSSTLTPAGGYGTFEVNSTIDGEKLFPACISSNSAGSHTILRSETALQGIWKCSCYFESAGGFNVLGLFVRVA